MKVEVVRELSGYRGEACLVKRGAKYFVVSSAVVPFTGPETLVFPATPRGEVTEYLEVAGGKGVNRLEAIAELERSDAV